METESKVSSGRFFNVVSVPEPTPVVSNPRSEVQAKLDKKHSNEEANYSYKPTLYTKPRKEHEKIDDNRYDRLYSDALKRHLEAKWKESIDDKELTFKPKISTKGSNSRSSSRERGATSESIEQRLLGLAPKTVQAEEFSFKPKITQRAKSIDRSQQRETPERLYLQSKTMQEKLENKRQESAVKAKEECTFVPKTNANSGRASLGTSSKSDLTERMSAYLAQKNQRLEEAIKAKQELEKENTTFNPTIKLTKRSSTPTSSSVFERLARTSSDNDLRSIGSESEPQFTFKPTLVAKRNPSPSPRGTEYKDIHERLFKEGQKRQQDLELERKLIQEENEYHMTFTPSINRRSLQPKEGPKESGPVFERLSTTSNRMYMQEVLTKIKEDLELKDCTFKPKLVSESKQIVRESTEPIYVRLNQEGERIKAGQAKMKEELAAESLKDVTFTPHINRQSSNFAKKRVSTADIHTRLNAEKLATHLPEPQIVEPPKKVLPKEDVEKIFRRLSITNTVSTEVAQTMRVTGGELPPESPLNGYTNNNHTVQRKKSVVMAEKDIDSLFQRLHTTSYDHDESQPALVQVKTLPPRAQSDLHERLSKSPAEAWLDKHDTLSPVRRSSLAMNLSSPSNDSYCSANSLNSSVVGTPREKTPREKQLLPTSNGGSTPKDKNHENRRDFFRDPAIPPPVPVSQNLAHVNSSEFPPTPPPASKVVPGPSKTLNGKNGGASKSNGGIAVEEVEELPVVVPTTVAAASAPVPVSNASTKATPAVSHKTTTPAPAATSAKASSNTAAAAGSGAAGAGSNPDFFSKLEASLAFLETQLDSKSTRSASKSSPVPANNDTAGPAPSYASVVKSVDEQVPTN